MSLEDIEKFAKNNPNNRLVKALEIYNKSPIMDHQIRHEEIFKAVHQYCRKNSGFFSRTKNNDSVMSSGGDRSALIKAELFKAF